MTCKCTLSDVIAAISAPDRSIKFINVKPQTQIRGICTDSRKIEPGQLFVALTGENFDGHEFVARAIALGAIAAVVQRDHKDNTSDNASDLPLLIVDDTLAAYQAIASWWRQKCNLPVVAVTGSAGKTTTKELIAALLSYYTEPGKSVHKSAANYNNDIGVAQTLLAIDPDLHNFVVVEMGMRGLGEIERLASVAQPNVSVITNIGTAHIGRLGSQAAIATAKCELLTQTPTDGIAVLNAEDNLLMQTASGVWQGHTISYGLNTGDIKGELEGDTLQIGSMAWQIPIPGRHNAMNFLAALGVLKALALDWQVTGANSNFSQIENFQMPAGRSQVHHLDREVTILDETYNASPEATIAALHLLASTPARRRWAVLGTMKELGEMSNSLHVKVGETIRNLGIDRLLVLTDGESDAILQGAGQDFPCAIGGSHAQLTEILLKLVEPGDLILFKASRSIGMDLVVKEFQQAWQANMTS